MGLKVDTDGSHTEVNHAPALNTPESLKKESDGGSADGVLAKCKPVDQTFVENGEFKITNTATRIGLPIANPSVRGGWTTGEHNQEEVDGIKSGGSSDRKFIPPGEDQFRKKNRFRRQEVDPNEDIWGTVRGQKDDPWGHDDRFVRDDDFYGKQAQRGEESFRPRSRGGPSSGSWRDRKGSEWRDQKSFPKSETSKTEPQPISVAPPPLPEEENWD
jgi:hypothetical protein